MEAKAMQYVNGVQQGATVQENTAARGAITATATPLHVLFSLNEVVRLTGLSCHTLKFWVRRRWINPIRRGSDGCTHGTMFSAWQTVALTIVGVAHRAIRTKRRSYIGRTTVIKAMEALKGLSDEMLLAESIQDPHVAENVAAIAHGSLTSHESELAPETYERLARVLEVLDTKAAAMRAWNR